MRFGLAADRRGISVMVTDSGQPREHAAHIRENMIPRTLVEQTFGMSCHRDKQMTSRLSDTLALRS